MNKVGLGLLKIGNSIYNKQQRVENTSGGTAVERNDIFEFKGTKKGLIMHIDSQVPFSDLLNVLNKQKGVSGDFFKGAKIIGVEGRTLNTSEEKLLAEVIGKNFGMLVTSLKPIMREKSADIDKKIKSVPQIDPSKLDALEEGPTKFLRRTLRSGQSEKYDGHVVVLGDVNPGAEVFAKGNVLVFGHMRGVVHAGSEGNEKAWVLALKLQPTQLRIGRLITRSPDDGDMEPTCPEMAYIKDGNIVIEPYASK